MKKHPIVIEAHRYAPELNKAFRLIGDRFVLVAKGGGFNDIKSFRQAKQRPIKPFIHAIIKTHYPDELKWLERTHSGMVKSRAEAIACLRHIRAGLTPAGSATICTRLVG